MKQNLPTEGAVLDTTLGQCESGDNKAIARRKYIIKKVRQVGSISFTDIEAELKNKYHPQSRADDAGFFESHGLQIEPTQVGFSAKAEGSSPTKIDNRKKLALSKKKAIGEMAAALLTGFNTRDWRDRYSDDILKQLQNNVSSKSRVRDNPDEELEKALSEYVDHQRCDSFASQVLENLKKGAKPNKKKGSDLSKLETDGDRSEGSVEELANKNRVLEFFEDYFAKTNRQVAIDAGSTTLKIAECLASNAINRLVRLRVLTNSPLIERALEKQSSPVDVVGIGGLLNKDTAARTGYLLDTCLSAWNLQADITIVGATSLRFDRKGCPLGFACDSESESKTKALMLEKATLRVVVMDSTKCERSAPANFEFCSSTSQAIDVVITDCGISVGNKNYRGPKCKETFLQRGIVVLEAGEKADFSTGSEATTS